VLFSEPKIPQLGAGFLSGNGLDSRFQCSSASRKFLNRRRFDAATAAACVSVLFSEPKIPQRFIIIAVVSSVVVSVLFSEPKIPQRRAAPRGAAPRAVSVLFSEPKIPQPASTALPRRSSSAFQCSSASRKFLNHSRSNRQHTLRRSFSALQRAENSST